MKPSGAIKIKIMNVMTGIFKNLFSCVILTACGVMLSVPVFAATNDNGCSNSSNTRITPMLALCSTHAYNIGFTKNPENSADRQAMRDVVALKTTVIAQQMYKQYEYLDATIKRLKTQLEREILTSKFEAAGASSSSSNSNRSQNNNIVLIGAEDCYASSNIDDGLACIRNNNRLVLQAVSSGNIGDAYRQLQKNLDYATAYGVKTPDGCATLSAKRDLVNNCANQLNITVMNKIDERSRSWQFNNMRQQ